MRTGRTGLSFKKGRTSLTTANINIRYLTFARNKSLQDSLLYIYINITTAMQVSINVYINFLNKKNNNTKKGIFSKTL